jgi:hypothetical protein
MREKKGVAETEAPEKLDRWDHGLMGSPHEDKKEKSRLSAHAV